MCGIAGAFAFADRAAAIDRDQLAIASAALAARGPDGQGLWLSADRRVGLAHRRLSILDLSVAGAQPMHAGGLHLTFNGEIYNFRALREALIARGHKFESCSDTEVLLALYRYEGVSMLRRLRGMFALALWDEQKQALLLARDAFGIKPLYYASEDGVFAFASQVKALRAARYSRGVIDPGAVVGLMSFGHVPQPRTLHEGLQALPPGSYLWVRQNHGAESPTTFASVGATIARAAKQHYGGPAAEVQGIARAAFLDSVRHHLVADVPVGAFLSAGIDSGSLLALMREVGAGEITTVTLAFEEFRNTPSDEAPLAATVAQRYGAQHQTCVISESDFLKSSESILTAMDQPSGDGFNSWFVSRAARQAGLKVAISGLGGDELLAGYPSFERIAMAPSGRPVTLPGAALLRGLHQSLYRMGVGKQPKSGATLDYGASKAGMYFLSRGLFMPWELSSIMPTELAVEGLRRFDPLAYVQEQLGFAPSGPWAPAATLESTLYMGNQLLRDSDWASMAHGLELRVPLVDFRLLETLAPLLAQRRGSSKKWLAQSPRRPIGKMLQNRPKTGFSIPLANWIKNPHSGLDSWRALPQLADNRCHWSRRVMYALARRFNCW